MLAKVITWGQDRLEAVRKMERALRDMVVLGVTTNIPYLLSILGQEAFRSGNTTTNYLEQHMAGWVPGVSADEDVLLAAAIFEALQSGGRRARNQDISEEVEARADPWNDLTSWRNVQGV
jgi:acetyl/propionyl-CoA carboxylase alpha subunit